MLVMSPPLPREISHHLSLVCMWRSRSQQCSVRAWAWKVNSGNGPSWAMRVPSTWLGREGGWCLMAGESNTSCSHWVTSAAGFLKGPEARRTTLPACYTAWLTDCVTANRSYDQKVTINPCLTEPWSWNGEVHVVPDFHNKGLSVWVTCESLICENVCRLYVT